MHKISDKVINFIIKAMKRLENGINSRRKNFSRGENQERHLPGRLAQTTTICYSLTYLRSAQGAINLQNHKKI